MKISFSFPLLWLLIGGTFFLLIIHLYFPFCKLFLCVVFFGGGECFSFWLCMTFWQRILSVIFVAMISPQGFLLLFNCIYDYFDGWKCWIFIYLFFCEFHFLFETFPFGFVNISSPTLLSAFWYPINDFRDAAEKCVHYKCFQLNCTKISNFSTHQSHLGGLIKLDYWAPPIELPVLLVWGLRMCILTHSQMVPMLLACGHTLRTTNLNNRDIKLPHRTKSPKEGDIRDITDIKVLGHVFTFYQPFSQNSRWSL